ncbi:exodeoxyribonuclease VII large subunit [Citricoccus sp. NR2]|uniref:exodeoxyribonuclease VII large subunit n=1 Tax=Citricoccus sp. NR2 TaxID=3004095 RepID=UPI0022DE1CDC|nr:exodeoxyribonuclease VII large subunit [Citricoccus sp. NR2]WBL17823.1 exodeoxyribonuclease VII large subunit [Citricoccus sp. NR2]
MTEPVPGTAGETSAESPWPLRLLSENLKAYLDRAPTTWIEGQLIEHKESRGHLWLTMRDLDEDYSMPVTVWRSTAARLGPGIEQGARVVAAVKPNFYTKTGRLNLIASEMRPVGLGDLLARVERLRRSLDAEGLFSPALKKPLPLLPERIGLITGRDSDAMKDVLRNTHLRWPAAEFELRPVAVQGPTAAREVMAALAELDADPRVDVIVIARGGGALEEVVLPFSDEALVRAVAAAQTPVVSAIGHEADRPVLDDVADVRASTPTDAAKRIVPDAGEERARINDARLRLASAVERRVRQEAEHLQQVRSRPVLAAPETMITQRHEDLVRLRDRARLTFTGALRREHDVVTQLRARVRSLSPQHTLDRGYAVVQHDAAVVRDAAVVSLGDELDILLAAGRLSATVSGSASGTTPIEPKGS